LARAARRLLGCGIALVFLAYSLWLFASARSGAWGFSFWRFCLTILFALIFTMPGLTTALCLWVWEVRRKLKPARAVGAWLLMLLASAFAVASIPELWCGAEAQLFKRKVQQMEISRYGEPRSFPFESSGLLYEEGRFSAHD